jgi:hypothetical protein
MIGRRGRTLAVCAATAFLFAGTALRADDNARAEKAVKEFLDDKKVSVPPTAIKDEALAKAFPDFSFFALTFPQYPVARLPPAPFKSQNVFAVPRDGKLIHLTDTKGLETFFKDNLKAVKDDDAAKRAAQAWLALSQTFRQDGFYKFSVPRDDLKVAEDKGERKASGKLVVTGGGKGDLTATLTFDEKGKLAKALEENAIKPGVRPICQATKLLDADPLVRRMAEQDLLVMGQACRGYLDEQRAWATPELQKAIDRVWKRIIEEGW